MILGTLVPCILIDLFNEHILLPPEPSRWLSGLKPFEVAQWFKLGTFMLEISKFGMAKVKRLSLD